MTRYIQTITAEHNSEFEVSVCGDTFAESSFELESIKLFGTLVGAGEIPARLYKAIIEYCAEQYDPAIWEKCYE